jgi:hypothetical protein
MATAPKLPTKRHDIEPLTQRKAWKALQAHHTQVRELHLRQLFADDPKRGERLTCEALGLFLDYSKNRVTTKLYNYSCNWRRNLVCQRGSTPCFEVRESTLPKTGRSCTWLCAPRVERRSWWTGRT